jgi:NAD(P)-binding Rossmann-like domain
MISIIKAFASISLVALLTDVGAVPHPDNPFDIEKFSPTNIITRDVCIIGGGSAGIYASIQLHDSGKSIVVIEKEDHIGGHTDTYIDKTTGEAINVGASMFHNISIVIDYFKRLGVPLVPPPNSGVKISYLDFDTGKPVPQFTPASTTAIKQALNIYARILAANYSYLEAGYYLPDPVPPELLIPFGDFATQYGIGAIVPLLNLYNQNNGELWKEPTLYVIKAFGLALIQAFQQGFVTSHNVYDLYTSAAKVLDGNILDSASIISMNRRASNAVKLIVNTPSGRKLVRAKKILMTGPPLIDNLQGWDLSDAERGTFTKFSSLGYFGAIVSNTGISQATYFENIGAQNPFFLNSLPGCYAIGPTNLVNQHSVYYGTPAPVSDGDAQDGITHQINQLADGGSFPAAATDFLYTTNHSPYRLYASVDDIKNGFYKNLYALQGTRNTFWSGAAWMTHDSSMVWTFTAALLSRISD